MPKSKQRRTLTQATIVDVAIRLADDEGIEALTMRKLSAQLGTTAMAIYNHVPGRDALIDIMLDTVTAEVADSYVTDPWRAAMEARAHAMRQMLLRHRWAAPLLMSRIVMGGAIMRERETAQGCLIRGEFTHAQADWARNAIDSHIYGYTIQELNFPVIPDAYQQAAAQYLPMIPRDVYPYTYAATEAIIDGSYDGLTQFDFGLGLILDGIERWIAGGSGDE